MLFDFENRHSFQPGIRLDDNNVYDSWVNKSVY